MFAGKFGRCVALPSGDILPMRVLANETEDFRKKLPPTNQSLVQQCSHTNIMLLRYLNKEFENFEGNLSNLLPAVRNKHECELCATL